jgi:hypothetical protein
MDMSMGGMSGGMEMTSDPIFRTYAQQLAEGYWYAIAGMVGFMLSIRAFEYFDLRSR